MACRFYEPKDDPEVQFKFQKSILELDMFTQMNTVGINELETLLQRYAESLKKVEDLSPNLVQSNTHRRMPATSRTKNEHTHYFERSISYNINEDYIPIDNERGGDQNYETFVELTDSGFLAVSKKIDDDQ